MIITTHLRNSLIILIQCLEIRIIMFLTLCVFIVCKAVILGLEGCKFSINLKYMEQLNINIAFNPYLKYYVEYSIGR